jgi:hypothetical protein
VTAPCCDIEIVDERGKVLTGTQTKIVGQRVQLRVRSVPGGSPLTNIQWSIAPAGTVNQPSTVKTYVQEPTGTATPLAPTDLQAESVSFYWISGELAGASRTVSVTATVRGQVKTKPLSYRVLRPRMDRFALAKSSVNVCAKLGEAEGPFLAAHRPPYAKGCKWTAQVTAPAGGDGKIAYTQLIGRNAKKTLANGTVLHKDSADRFVLDDAAGIQYAGSKPIGAGSSENLDDDRYGDSPGITLTPDMVSAEGDDSFELYLMYRPDGADSIWVTLGLGRWAWTGKTTRIGAPGTTNEWSQPTGTSLMAVDGVDWVKLPQWTHKATEAKWV